MKITLYRAFPDPYRQSMTFYADQLSQRMSEFLGEHDSTRSYLPRNIVTQPPLLRYGSQYILYHCLASFAQGDVNHVIDHAYGHLVHALDPKKTIVTFHDAIRLKAHGLNGKSRSHGWLHAYNLDGIRKAARVILISEASRQDFLSMVNYPIEKTIVIPVGIEDEFFVEPSEDERQKLNLTDDFHLLHVGHTGHYKNVDGVLHVLAKLREQGKRVKLIKTGMAFTKSQESIIAKHKLAPYILHLGLVNREELPGIYRASDALLFPSYDEGFGIPLVEAMASKTPVISSTRGALPEVLGDAGLLIDPDDHDGMVEAVTRMMQDQAYRTQFVQKGSDRAKHYTIREVVRKTFEVYQDVYKEIQA